MERRDENDAREFTYCSEEKKKKKGRTRKVKHHGQHSGKAEGLRFLAMCFFMCLHRLYDSRRRVKGEKKKRLTFVLSPFYPLLRNNSTHDVSMSGLFALRYFQHVSTLINSCKVRLRVPAAVNLPQFATCTHLYEQKKKKRHVNTLFSLQKEKSRQLTLLHFSLGIPCDIIYEFSMNERTGVL